MNAWLKLIIFSVLLGCAKGAHFIRLVILAGLGLAGLWMVHTLAQDFNEIQMNGGLNFNANSNDGRDVFKRSIEGGGRRGINWEMVLSRDPASCARSFLCQLSATQRHLLTEDEMQMLSLVRYSVQEESWASQQLQAALKTGEKVNKPNQCMNIYKFCPYTSRMMMTLLKIFGR